MSNHNRCVNNRGKDVDESSGTKSLKKLGPSHMSRLKAEGPFPLTSHVHLLIKPLAAECGMSAISRHRHDGARVASGKSDATATHSGE